MSGRAKREDFEPSGPTASPSEELPEWSTKWDGRQLGRAERNHAPNGPSKRKESKYCACIIS